MTFNIEVQGVCKNTSCNLKRVFRTTDKIAVQLYCSEACWIEQWCRTGSGLVHPKFINMVKNSLGNEGRDLAFVKEIITHLEENKT